MTRRTNYRGFVCENTNQEVRIVSSYLTRLKKTARAGKWGEDIYCPQCNKQHRVYHFAWSAIHCDGCNEYIEKEQFPANVNDDLGEILKYKLSNSSNKLEI